MFHGIRDRVTLATILSTTVSIAMMAVCGIAAIKICGDMNDLYHMSLEEIKAFKALTDDAWKEVVAMNIPQRRQPDDEVGREKRDDSSRSRCSKWSCWDEDSLDLTLSMDAPCLRQSLQFVLTIEYAVKPFTV
ncbi:nematode cuticle collagen domain protein [Cooperia oncophora]